jgi:hypothetical protein
MCSVAGPVVFDGSGSDTDDDDDDDVSPDEFQRQEAILALVVGVRQYLNDLEAITQVGQLWCSFYLNLFVFVRDRAALFHAAQLRSDFGGGHRCLCQL